MATKKSKTKSKITKSASKSPEPVLAKSEDGTIQITFTIPFEKIEKSKLDAINELGKDINVPGFRKGKAPIDKVADKIPQNTLIEKALASILPKLLHDVVTKNKLTLAIYPKFELIKAQEGSDWQIRATTCEMPEIELGEYKKAIRDAKSAKSIWTPDKGKPENNDEKDKQISQAEKEHEVMKILLQTVKIKIPSIIIQDEVNSKLAKLLERIEKLGLILESYLSSLGKTSESLRAEYEEQSRQTITIDFILAKIAEEEKIDINKEQVDQAIKASSTDPELTKKLDTPEQRRIIESILKRRKALDYLTALLSI